MMITENGCKERGKEKAAVVADVNTCVGRVCTRSCGTCNVRLRMVGPLSHHDSGQGNQISGFFQIADLLRTRERNKDELRSKPKDMFEAGAAPAVGCGRADSIEARYNV